MTIKSKPTTEAYRREFDRIFNVGALGKKKYRDAQRQKNLQRKAILDKIAITGPLPGSNREIRFDSKNFGVIVVDTYRAGMKGRNKLYGTCKG